MIQENGVSRSNIEREVTLLWDQSQGVNRGQPLVAIPAGEMAEFFAFAATYIASFRPFTAFFRVIPLELAGEISDRQSTAEDIIAPFARLVAGGSLAERYLRTRSRPSDPNTSALTIMNTTLSACLGTGVLAGYSADAIYWLADQWDFIRTTTNSFAADQTTRVGIAHIWRFLSYVVRSDHDKESYVSIKFSRSVSEFIRASLHSGVDAHLLKTLSPILPKSTDLSRILGSSREERILAFNSFLSAMESDTYDFEKSFIAGLLLAIVGNGSFDMLRSAKDLADKSPVAIIWFGICAALFQESNVLTSGNCLGRRFVRDIELSNEYRSAPRSDLSVFEYQALTNDPAVLEQIISSTSDAFALEILPDVLTYVPKRARNDESRQSDEFRLILEGLLEIRHVVDRTQRRLSRPIETAQRELFRSEPKPRGRQR